MTAEAADWSEHDLDHRFNVGEPHDELTQLAATFDSMLARLASSLRHEQLLSAELSHELRTPLAAIVTEAELALRRERGDDEYREALREIESRASQMQSTLETLMAAARAESLRGPGDCARVVGRRAGDRVLRARRRRCRDRPEAECARRFGQGRRRRRHRGAHPGAPDRERSRYGRSRVESRYGRTAIPSSSS